MDEPLDVMERRELEFLRRQNKAQEEIIQHYSRVLDEMRMNSRQCHDALNDRNGFLHNEIAKMKKRLVRRRAKR